MSAVPKRKLTEAEYLVLERAAERKSEFYDGEMFLMAGASPDHNRIKENLIGELFARIKGGPCQSFSSDQRVRLTESGTYAYPDIVIVCDPPAYAAEDQDTLVNPQVVIEVLSPSTERYDRGFKFAQYQLRPSVREVVFASQDTPRVERYVRQPGGAWELTVFAGLAAEFALGTTPVPVRVPLADVYRGVTFPASPSR